MEHELLQLLHLPPQDHLMDTCSGFFVGDTAVHLPSSHESEFVEPGAVALAGGLDDCEWMEDLMLLGDELFGGDGTNATAGDHQHPQPTTQQQGEGGGGSSTTTEDPPPSCGSLDGGDGSPPSAEQDDAWAATRKRRDRSKTIVSERKRRVRMKETLYELRALVPNITKMDKASIIADAVVYVKNLQSHATKLKEEIATLEACPSSRGHHQQKQNAATAAGSRPQGQARGGAPADGDDDAGSTMGSPAGARVTHVGATQVGDGRFFVTVECERRDGMAAPLCAAVESLVFFRVESSSLGRSGLDRVVSTHVLKASDQLGDATIGEGTVKLWIMAALLKEGFQPEATADIS